MNTDLIYQLITLGIVGLVFLIFVKDWLSPDLTAMGAFVFLVIIGVIDTKEALGIFGSSAPVTVAAMFIMSAVLERTGLIELLAGRFETLAGNSHLRTSIVLLLLVAFLSAFVNNTPVVVVFMPIVLAHCRKTGLKASGLLIPLSYAAIVGGTCTIIGTSTNLIANGIASEYLLADGTPAMEPFGMFEVSKLGIIFVVGTIVYLIFGGAKLIPDRTTLSTLFDAEEGHEYLTQAYVTPDSPLVGKRFTESPLSKNRALRIIEVVREGRPLSVPLNKLEFDAGDLVIMKTRASGVMEINEIIGLDLTPNGELGLDHVRTESAVLMEGIVGPSSKLIGHTLKELNFRQRFGVVIIAVHRRGVNLRARFEDVKLAFGDTLLVEGPTERMSELFNEKDFVNLSKPKAQSIRRAKAPIAIGALLLFMVGGALFPPMIPFLALASVLITLITRCIDPEEAYQAVEWRVIFMIFGMLGLGMALNETGIAEIAAQAVAGNFKTYGPHVVLAALYLLTAILTEMISNNAVAALLTPIAIGIGIELGYDPRPFVVAVMFASSASFVTPIGYQTNTYVYGAGGYKFTDFSKVGLPLAVVLWITASILIPKLWPF
ncbi:MAG: SLC13 family permease [Verrucomicrobiales bacterium]|nr:SLC13 family permease [Verrucomicrobiales bacterium]